MRRLLFLGDIIGAPGREAVVHALPGLRQALALDWVVANAENSAGGSGITRAIARSLTSAGVDVITLGDHTWGQRGFEQEIVETPQLCRPANLSPRNPGATHIIAPGHDGARLLVFTVLGRQFMQHHVDCPFDTAERMLRELEGQYDCALVEIHAEATSEKIALGWYLDGKVSLVVGTHTHVATADASVLPRGTAYQTDAGMCGPHTGVIGREIAPVIGRFLDGMPRRLPVATEDVRLNGCLVSIDEKGHACTVSRFEWRA
ncbi:MAG: YmdB family metallophosphoesterase [Puniceicoccales bacterium]|nr:YmdB family metallophosphoesterase [Puniceicoccales bacterium]